MQRFFRVLVVLILLIYMYPLEVDAEQVVTSDFVSLPCVKIPNRWAILALPNNTIEDFSSMVSSLTGVSVEKARQDLQKLNAAKLTSKKRFSYLRVTRQTSRALASKYATVIQKNNKRLGCGQPTRPARILIVPKITSVKEFMGSMGVRSNLAFRLLAADAMMFNPDVNFLNPNNQLDSKQMIFLPQSFPFNIASLQQAQQQEPEQAKVQPPADPTNDKPPDGYTTAGLYFGAEIGAERIVLQSVVNKTSSSARAISAFSPRARGFVGYDYFLGPDKLAIEGGLAGRNYNFVLNSTLGEASLDLADLEKQAALFEASVYWESKSRRFQAGITSSQEDMLIIRRSSIDVIRIIAERVTTIGPFVKVTRGNPKKITYSGYAHPQAYLGSESFNFNPGYVLAAEVTYNTKSKGVYFMKYSYARGDVVESGFEHGMDVYALTFGVTLF